MISIISSVVCTDILYVHFFINYKLQSNILAFVLKYYRYNKQILMWMKITVTCICNAV